MSEREEFDEWVRESLVIPMNFDKLDSMWATWQAARASRWRSMESADKSGNYETILLSNEYSRRRPGYWSPTSEAWVDCDLAAPEFNPIAWHPLPDPPTKEELENLK